MNTMLVTKTLDGQRIIDMLFIKDSPPMIRSTIAKENALSES